VSEAIIQAEGLGKRYAVGERQRYLALRDVLTNIFAAPSWIRRREPRQFMWALRDVSFSVAEGEVVGLIGRNGAGKSTLLKLLARITRPTTGRAEIRGRVGSLLEVGTGFHPELTGRENVYLSGSILGMKKKEIESKFDAIVEFANVDQFIDTPLKHYSSGMQMRLAFAVAAHLEPEILLVDEVLAVGDIQFQKKCLGKMQEVSRSGRTILFVSHQMNQIRRLCERVLWIDAGQIRQAGPTAEIAAAYELSMSSGNNETPSRSSAAHSKAHFVSWEIVEPRGERPDLLESLGPVTIKFVVDVRQSIRLGHHGAALYNNEGQLIWARAADNLNLREGTHEFYYTFPMLPLRPGVYSWQVSLWNENGMLDLWNCSPELIVASENHQHPLDQWNGILNMPSQIEIHELEGVKDAAKASL
jgi:lipopolysaccharide transport system ATP-binding protein